MPIREEQIQRAIELAREYGATRLILFGSAATRPHQARDLDLACDGVSDWKLYELGARLLVDDGFRASASSKCVRVWAPRFQRVFDVRSAERSRVRPQRGY
jgi:hypothetical protein